MSFKPRYTLLIALIVATTAPVAAEPPATPVQPAKPVAQPAESPGFLRSESLRYPDSSLPVRVLADIPAIPASVVTWDVHDWLLFGGVAGTVGGLMVPTDPPPDVRLNRWLVPKADDFLPEIWALKYQVGFWTALGSGLLTTWGIAWLIDDEPVMESMSLVTEAVIVGQVYHLSLKLALGRDRDGELQGFPYSLKIFPRGTPSGHFTTLYAAYGALEAYWQPHWGVRVGMHALLASLWITHMLNDKHYLSEHLFGAWL